MSAHNNVILMIGHNRPGKDAFYPANLCCIILMTIFTIEVILKLIAFGYRYYFSLNSYRVCSGIVLLSWLSMAWNNGVMLPFSMLMLFRFLLVIGEFRKIWEILVWCAPKLFYLFIFSFLIIFVFAVFGVALINQDPHVSYHEKSSKFDTYLDLLQNPALFFQDVFHAWMTLYVGVAGGADSWTPVLFGVLKQIDNPLYHFTIVLYFVSFWVAMVIIIASLFMATLIDYYRDFSKAEEIEKVLATLNDLKAVWKQEIVQRRNEYFNKQSKRQWRQNSSTSLDLGRDFIDGKNLFETFLPATTLIDILKSCAAPAGFRDAFETDNDAHDFEIATHSNRIISASMYRFLMVFFENLYIPVRKNSRPGIRGSLFVRDNTPQSHMPSAVNESQSLYVENQYSFYGKYKKKKKNK
ncbi:hypothetical protein RFI_06722 [Reticulomyxa filosa]|uniref:Ion transport domain-containing protein n=1 Tax=Reticulomyxa filosa TaxID=46433 RepID=X6NX60_RETFI|nr:hypothetical protein RFI_06722 [Reticulomyxa filosa]|eukprot:ETO30399.1 hypothetical protein RFI_06722 [Reticulomyxa filosa]